MSSILNRIRWSVAPDDATPVQRRNFRYVQIDAIGIGLANAASPFLPVFLTRLGASNFQIGLLTAMPAATGLVLAILVGNFLQKQRNVVPWFSLARLLVISAYAATGLAPFLVPDKLIIQTVLLIWAVATLPQTAVAVGFSVVMNAVAGPSYRYDLMSRRWSILGLVTALTVALAGQVLEWIGFPLNYQVVFLGLSLGGLISYIFSSRIQIPDTIHPPAPPGRTLAQRVRAYFDLVRGHPDFVRFSVKRFVYLTGSALALPLFPLYYVRVVNASDASIGLINTAQTIVLLFGYFYWTQVNRKRGPHFVLLATTFGMSLYPVLVAVTQRVELIILISGLAGIVAAGVDLVFFDELMKTVPVEYSATFVSLAQSLQYTSSVLSPLIGAWLANQIGLSGALLVSGGIRLVGFLLFAFWRPARAAN